MPVLIDLWYTFYPLPFDEICKSSPPTINLHFLPPETECESYQSPYSAYMIARRTRFWSMICVRGTRPNSRKFLHPRESFYLTAFIVIFTSDIPRTVSTATRLRLLSIWIEIEQRVGLLPSSHSSYSLKMPRSFSHVEHTIREQWQHRPGCRRLA
jgi:hypothetical protein